MAHFEVVVRENGGGAMGPRLADRLLDRKFSFGVLANHTFLLREGNKLLRSSSLCAMLILFNGTVRHNYMIQVQAARRPLRTGGRHGDKEQTEETLYHLCGMLPTAT